MAFYELMMKVNQRFRHILKPNMLDLSGDRDIEWSFVTGHIPDGESLALDFGCGDMPVGLAAALKGWHVTGIDLTRVRWLWEHPRMRFLQADLLEHDFGATRFSLVLNCSTVEHVGLGGRYGSAFELDGDLKAMQCLRDLLQPDGIMLLTIPIGQDSMFAPVHRIYGAERLPRLLKGFSVQHEEYWLKRHGKNVWICAGRDEALKVQGSRAFYALGLFVLVPDENPVT